MELLRIVYGGEMKIICDCGNEVSLFMYEYLLDNILDKGEYVVYAEVDNFVFWHSYDKSGILCNKCGEAIDFNRG